MCLAALALRAHPRFDLVLAANRDEYFDRPALPMAWWAHQGITLLSGRDAQAGGTWLGLSREGRVALLTNVREPGPPLAEAPSRGTLVLDGLTSTEPPTRFAATPRQHFHGFNLVLGDVARQDWLYVSNRPSLHGQVQALEAGLHALSNAALNTPWPKTTGLRQALQEALADAVSARSLADRLLLALADRQIPPDADLPDTGVGPLRERWLAPRCVRIPDPADPHRAAYGTRCSTVLIREVSGATLVIERRLDADGLWDTPQVHELPRWPA